MNNAIFNLELPQNEPVRSYAPGTKERELLHAELKKMSSEQIDIPIIIGGKEIRTGNMGKVVMPHNHNHVLATYHKAGEKEVQLAIDTALKAHREWESVSYVERMSIMLKMAELLTEKYRYIINASTMLGQSKNAYQAEIDAACETIDFLRFNAYYMTQIYNDQPLSEEGIINRLEYRPLEGFVFTVSPFNFTSIAANLSMAPAMLGNVIVWKPATTSLLSNYYLMQLYKEAGLPDGVINFVPGQGSLIGNNVLKHKDLVGIHFTGSNNTFNHLWKSVGQNLENYKSYPKVVGETGGKDFIFVHHSAKVDEVATAIVRGAFEYQGQKCSAASRAYIPESLWEGVKAKVVSMLKEIKLGDVNQFSNFMNAVIDQHSFNNIKTYIDAANKSEEAEIVFGGGTDNSKGYFVEPTVVKTTDPHFISMEEEIFGPFITIFVYKDIDFEETLHLCDQTSPYALTGAIFATDRQALTFAARVLKYAAGNFYYNDKPTGAVVGQQPFGGSRASGTNDKAGSHLNLIRWTNPRTIKETLVPATDFKYPFMEE